MMHKNNKTEPIKNDPYGCDIPHSMDIKACSSTDCTGLIPSLPQTDDQLESYEDLYHHPGGLEKE